MLADRYKWFDDFFANFYNTDELAPERIGDAALRASFQVAAVSSRYASYACVDTWLTDFRADIEKIDIPTLVVHGTKDPTLPLREHGGPSGGAQLQHPGRAGRDRPAQHRLDLPGGVQPSAAELPQLRSRTPLDLRALVDASRLAR